MSDFGDFDPDDAVDHEPADPEQIARKLHELQVFFDRLAGGTLPAFDDLDSDRQAEEIATAATLIGLIEHDRDDGHDAEALHNARRQIEPQLPPWDQLAPDEQQIGRDLVRFIIDLEERQGDVP